jgi:alpha/beta superfamily hydrolase
MVRLKCSLTGDIKENTILADNGATHTIINEDWASLVEDFEELEGSVTGSTQGTLGQVVGKGTIHFFGEKLQCYVANITTSVFINRTDLRTPTFHGMETPGKFMHDFQS